MAAARKPKPPKPPTSRATSVAEKKAQSKRRMSGAIQESFYQAGGQMAAPIPTRVKSKRSTSGVATPKAGTNRRTTKKVGRK